MTVERRQLTAGVVLLFGFVYLVLESVSAMAWTNPPYDWARNLISDLGYADCATVDGDRICSPLHPLMNTAFVIQGTVFAIGGMLVPRIIASPGPARLLVTIALLASGVGTVFVGIFHQSLALSAAGLNWLHVLAATLAIGLGNLGIVGLGALSIRRAGWRGYGIAALVIGGIGLIAAALLVARIDFGWGLGLIERIAVYPLNTWTIGTGIGLVAKVASYRVRRVAETARANAGVGP